MDWVELMTTDPMTAVAYALTELRAMRSLVVYPDWVLRFPNTIYQSGDTTLCQLQACPYSKQTIIPMPLLHIQVNNRVESLCAHCFMRFNLKAVGQDMSEKKPLTGDELMALLNQEKAKKRNVIVTVVESSTEESEDGEIEDEDEEEEEEEEKKPPPKKKRKT